MRRRRRGRPASLARRIAETDLLAAQQGNLAGWRAAHPPGYRARIVQRLLALNVYHH
jgi:hypothetical protein